MIVDPYVWQQALNTRAGCDLGGITAFRWLTAEIPAELRSRKSEVRAALMHSLALNARQPKTLLHQDTHPRNWFQVPDGSVCLYDWQAIAKGNWALDVSYALSSVLDIEDRRNWERELLELYLDELGANGGSPPSHGEAWLAYRQQLVHGLIFWAYTSAVNRFREVHPEDVTRAIVARTAQAMVDLETLDALG
ncbi:phosphotransferase [Mycobacterium sp. E2327]|uniref:phosphotransferase n=1 Tax=Mycobacterium sp. E2327 TaxID=1834132 RepID=UPI0018D32F66|nr:phosphotransferase [Mycobacterium sp. E2327]